MSNRNNLSQRAEEIVAFIDKNPKDTGGKGGRDVSKEPRVPKGSPDGGQWTDDGAPSHGGDAKSHGGGANRGAASRQGLTVTIVRPDGTTEVRKDGSRAWRNNNPGNIGVIGPFAKDHGAIGSDGERAIFPDEATGTAAQKALLKGKYASFTIDAMIERWAPPSENDTAAYQDFVQKVSGLSGDKIVGDLTPEELQRLMNAQRRHEGWNPGEVTHQ